MYGVPTRSPAWRIGIGSQNGGYLTHVNMSHASEFQRLGGVDFYDDFLCSVNIYRRVADSGGRIEFTVRSDLADFELLRNLGLLRVRPSRW